MNFLGFTAKGGANYNFNDNHNVFANVGYISRAPKYSYGAFMTADKSNVLNKEAVNEKVFSAELGYGFRNSWITANLNLYYTRWMDKTMTKSVTLDNQQNGNINMAGLAALHKGAELDVKVRPFRWLELTGMVSLGDWKWDSDATGYVYDEMGNAMTKAGTVTTPGAEDHAKAVVKMNGVRVGGSAQTTAAVGANVNITKALRVGADWTYYGRNYAYYAVDGTILSVGKRRQWQSPGRYLLQASWT